MTPELTAANEYTLRAMAAAMVYPEAQKGGRGKKSAIIQSARHVLATLPETAPLVLSGEKPLQDNSWPSLGQKTRQRVPVTIRLHWHVIEAWSVQPLSCPSLLQVLHLPFRRRD